MTDVATPLTPSDCDLRDFPYVQVEVKRLLTSETWILGTGDERAAAITLWFESWHQVPAGSLPNNDRMLAHLSQSKNWRKVKEHALRGWVLCADGKLYHPVVAEKALEAWMTKLLSSVSGATGNAKRWGIVVDTEAVKGQIIEATRLLQAIAPQSETLRKRQVREIVSGSLPDSQPDQKYIAPRSENSSPPESPPDRNREGEGNRDRDRDKKEIPPNPLPPDGGMGEEGANGENPSGKAKAEASTPTAQYDCGNDGKATRQRKPRTTLKTFLATCKTNAVKPVTSYRPLMDYVDRVKLPSEFLALAWDVFRREHLEGGVHAARTKADWQRHFANYVEKGYYRLWFCKPDGTFELTSQGLQAKAFHNGREAA